MAQETEGGIDKKVYAEELKFKANQFFKEQKYPSAISLYTDAIEADPTNAVYYANRSISNLRIENFGYALSDATKAIELDKTYLKAYYRRAAAHMALGKYKAALRDYEAVYKAKPSDKDAKAKFQECKKIVQKAAFERAIAVDEKVVLLSETIDPDSITVPDSYDGPRLIDGKVTIEFMRDLLPYYYSRKVLHSKYAYQILLSVKSALIAQSTLVDIDVPDKCKFTICGDIHGQFYDLLNIFKINGQPSEDNRYLFNGDFVDRGSFSVEVIFVLFGFKLLYPDKFFMSRGNHETSVMNSMYGFSGEVKAKYSKEMDELFTEVYNWLPLCHRINEKILVMHGGLFNEDDVTLDDIRKIDRNRQPPNEGVMCDILWSDPQPMLGRSPSKRGLGCHFGPDITEKFLKQNSLDYIVRSHEVKENGYELNHDEKCITVFSAPNYCDTVGNKGAFINITGDNLKPEFVTFEAVPHPNVQPMAYAANSFLNMLC